ncbi:MarR family winged helix-turn-helix transcriptional regulator [Pedobacter flavus]|uniref:MarR family transcriptional regulator n=1 Tax=Pedobacter flavus TaxID=3113906 RepID=A0ABU7GYP3_9SPHI|nr:MarR family transcriptional regulator [Pedobacter sp. VNH31]MEE1884142.1 MarR family transcriptional regulator [Pedobacter sp. VNH31]
MHHQTLDYHLKLAWQAVLNKYNQIASTHGISQAIGYMLINIEENGTAVTKLASLQGVKPTSLSRMLVSMEKSGMITREIAADDKRSILVKLTSEGKEKQKIAKSVVKRFNEYLNASFGEEEQQQLSELLKKLNVLATEYSVEYYEQEN